MEKSKSLEEIYMQTRPETKKQFREIQAYLQEKYPHKKIGVIETMQIIVADRLTSIKNEITQGGSHEK